MIRLSGEAKQGDLSGVYIHKFGCINQLCLLAYEYAPAITGA
ncbi:MAG: type II toxin-antitoxin system RelE/ParE family toxin [Sulfuriferula sp.]